MLKFLVVCLLVGSLLGCASWEPVTKALTPDLLSSGDEAKSIEAAKVAQENAMNAEIGLRLAELANRVDELETQQVWQKERLKLLEKGLMLGIIPEELTSDKKAPVHPVPTKSSAKFGEVHSTISHSEQKSVDTPAPSLVLDEKSRDTAEYRNMLQVAQNKFNSANYGQAIVDFNAIGEKFDDSLTEGSQNYWIGLAWFYLKEYQLAEQSFKKIVDLYGKNSWVPHARFYLAKIDLNRGLSGRARDQFRLILDEFQSQELGEMARMEIERMRDKL